mgnify:CR=1 FL=1
MGFTSFAGFAEAAQKSERRILRIARRALRRRKTRVSASRDALLVIEDKREARELHRVNCAAQEAAAVLCITQYAANQRAVHRLL